MTVFWIALFAAGALVLAYQRVSLRTATLTLGLALAAYTWFGQASLVWQIVLWVGFTLLALLNLDAVRMRPRPSRGRPSPACPVRTRSSSAPFRGTRLPASPFT